MIGFPFIGFGPECIAPSGCIQQGYITYLVFYHVSVVGGFRRNIGEYVCTSVWGVLLCGS